MTPGEVDCTLAAVHRAGACDRLAPENEDLTPWMDGRPANPVFRPFA